MLNAHTTFVIGAGAGKEIGFPVGNELLEEIESILSFDMEFGRPNSGNLNAFEAILQYSMYENNSNHSKDDLIYACEKLVKTSKQATSIDTLIDTLQDECVSIVGKIAISTAILEAEKNSSKFKTLSNQPFVNIAKFKNTWYRHLSQNLFSETKSDNLDNIFNNITVIMFNYDRCLEQYLIQSITQHYHVTFERSEEIVSRLKILRPYGSVGLLPWQNGSKNKCNFGSVSNRSIYEVSKEIQTFTEQKLDNKTISEIKSSIRESDLIVFLGFGFHKQNIELISSNTKESCHIYATCLGVPEPAITVICNDIAKSLSIPISKSRQRITFADMTCCQFFEQFATVLTASSPSLQISLDAPHIYRCAPK